MIWNPRTSASWQAGLRQAVRQGHVPGFHILASPPGQQAPIQHINYTPSTNEVHGRGVFAPPDALNYSLIPEDEMLSDMGAGIGGRSAGGGAAIGTGMIGAGQAHGVPPIAPTVPGQERMVGRYAPPPSMASGQTAPGMPPLQPGPFGTGPGPRATPSSPVEAPFEARSQTRGTAVGWGGMGGGQEATPTPRPSDIRDVPVIGGIVGALGGLGNTRPSATPTPTPSGRSPEADAAAAAANQELYDRAAGGGRAVNATPTPAPEAGASPTPAAGAPAATPSPATGGAAAAATAVPGVAVPPGQPVTGPDGKPITIPPGARVLLTPAQSPNPDEPPLSTGTARIVTADGAVMEYGLYSIDEVTQEVKYKAYDSSGGAASQERYVFGSVTPAGIPILDKWTGASMIMPGTASPQASAEAIQAGGAGTLLFNPTTNTWETVPGSQLEAQQNLAKTQFNMGQAAYELTHPAPQVTAEGIITPPGANIDINYPDVPWAPEGLRGTKHVRGGPVPQEAQDVASRARDYVANVEQQYPGGIIPPVSMRRTPAQAQAAAPPPQPQAAVPPPAQPSIPESLNRVGGWAQDAYFHPVAPLPIPSANLDLPELPIRGGAGAGHMGGRSSGMGGGRGGSGMSGGGGVGQEADPNQWNSSLSSPGMPPVFNLSLRQPVPYASDDEHKQAFAALQAMRPRPPGQLGTTNMPMGTGQEPSPAGWQPPVPTPDVQGIGHRFGQPMNQGEPMHSGVDLQAEEGVTTKSPVDGFVMRVENNPEGLGIAVVIRGQDGSEHRLGHLEHTDAYPGMQVKQGMQVGTVGSTGNTTGSHLHWGVRDEMGQPVDNTPALPPAMQSMPPVPGTEMMGPPGGTGGAAQVGAGGPSNPWEGTAPYGEGLPYATASRAAQTGGWAVPPGDQPNAEMFPGDYRIQRGVSMLDQPGIWNEPMQPADGLGAGVNLTPGTWGTQKMGSPGVGAEDDNPWDTWARIDPQRYLEFIQRLKSDPSRLLNPNAPSAWAGGTTNAPEPEMPRNPLARGLMSLANEAGRDEAGNPRLEPSERPLTPPGQDTQYPRDPANPEETTTDPITRYRNPGDVYEERAEQADARYGGDEDARSNAEIWRSRMGQLEGELPNNFDFMWPDEQDEIARAILRGRGGQEQVSTEFDPNLITGGHVPGPPIELPGGHVPSPIGWTPGPAINTGIPIQLPGGHTPGPEIELPDVLRGVGTHDSWRNPEEIDRLMRWFMETQRGRGWSPGYQPEKDPYDQAGSAGMFPYWPPQPRGTGIWSEEELNKQDAAARRMQEVQGGSQREPMYTEDRPNEQGIPIVHYGQPEAQTFTGNQAGINTPGYTSIFDERDPSAHLETLKLREELGNLGTGQASPDRADAAAGRSPYPAAPATAGANATGEAVYDTPNGKLTLREITAALKEAGWDNKGNAVDVYRRMAQDEKDRTYQNDVGANTAAQIQQRKYEAQLQVQQAIQQLLTHLQEAMMSEGQQVLMTQGAQAFADHQTRQQDQLQLLNSALASPWLQSLSGISPIPGHEGSPTGVPDVLNQMGQIFTPYDYTSWLKGNPYAPPTVNQPGTIPGVPSVGGNPALPGAAVGTSGTRPANMDQPAPSAAPRPLLPPGQAGMPGQDPNLAGWPVPGQDTGGITHGPMIPADQPADQAGTQMSSNAPGGYHWNTDQSQILDTNEQPTGWYVPSWQQWQAWTPAQKASYRLSIERYGRGAWDAMSNQMNRNFRQQGATSTSANMTPLQAASADTAAMAGSQMTADVLGQRGNWGPSQAREWSAARAPGVQQKVTSGIAP